MGLARLLTRGAGVCSGDPRGGFTSTGVTTADFYWVPASGKEPTCQCRRRKRLEFDPWVGKIPWRRAWQPTPVCLPGESHGRRSLEGYSPWSRSKVMLKILQARLQQYMNCELPDGQGGFRKGRGTRDQIANIYKWEVWREMLLRSLLFKSYL